MSKAGARLVGKVLEVDKGFNQLKYKMDQGRRPYAVSIGINAAEGQQEHPSGMTIAQLAFIHERGLGDIPKRSFLVDSLPHFTFLTSKNFANLIADAMIKGGSTMSVLLLAGAKGLAVVKARMRAGIDPPLSPITIENKKRKKRKILTALFDEGILYKSLSFVVGPRSMFGQGDE